MGRRGDSRDEIWGLGVIWLPINKYIDLRCDLVALFLWCDKRQLTEETVRDQILFYAFLYWPQTLVLIS